MECNKWEEIGLLYTSGELTKKDSESFEAHMKECSDCDLEFSRYEENKKFFTPEILSEAPSTKVDAEILRVCSKGVKRFTFLGLTNFTMKKAALSSLFFVIGFVVVGYFAMNNYNTNSSSSVTANQNNQTTEQNQTAQNSIDQKALTANSSDTTDSLNDTLRKVSPRGNLDKGVITVDLNTK